MGSQTGRQIGEVRKGYGVRLLPADPEAVFAVVKDPDAEPPEERFMFGVSTLLAGADVNLVLGGERDIDDVLVPDADDPRAFELGKGRMLLFERADEPGHYDVLHGPARVEEVTLMMAS
jgi:hypothetical protein